MRRALAQPGAVTTAPNIAPKLWTPEEVSAAVGFHEESIRRLIRAGRIPAIRCGRFWRVRQPDFDTILQQGIPSLE